MSYSFWCYCKQTCFLFLFLFSYKIFSGLHPWHTEVPRRGVESELQVPVYPIPTATPDLSHMYDLHHSSQQCRLLNSLSEARDQTRKPFVPNQIRFYCIMMRTPNMFLFLRNISLLNYKRKIFVYTTLEKKIIWIILYKVDHYKEEFI